MSQEQKLTQEEIKEMQLVELELKKIRQDPYNYICDYVETLLPHVGRNIFEVVSLMPASLIIPDLPYMNKKFRSNINCLFLAPSGCIDGDSYIATATGTFKKIKRYGDYHLQSIDENVKINPQKGQFGYDKANTFHRYDNQETFKITLDSGRTLILNSTHPLLNEKDEWILAQNLKIGDSVRVMHKINCFKKNYEKFNIEIIKKYNAIKIPLCNEEVATLMGYALGDGHTRKRYEVNLYINNEESDIIKILENYIILNFSIVPHLHVRDLTMYKSKIGEREIKRTQSINMLSINNDNFNKIFQFVREKHVPEIIMASKKSVVAGFLRGLFEADGSCDMNKKSRRYRISLTSMHNHLLQEILLLLLKFEIKAKIESQNISIYKLEDIKTFNEEIGFLSEKKKCKLKNIVDSIKIQRKMSYNYRYTEKIKKIESAGIRTVYDLNVEKYHRYIANGIVSHNSGKSTIAKLFANLTYNPLEVESITSAKLEMCIMQNPKFSLIIGDFARMSRDPIIIKVMEGILGEEQSVKRQTMRSEIDLETDGVGLICGTPADLSHYIAGGLLFRLVPKIILANQEYHTQIGSHIKDSICQDSNNDIVEMAIKSFYKELLMIQNNEHPNLKPVTGYHIEKRFSEKAFQVWDKLTNPMVAETHSNFFRGLQEFYRFLVSHAFLNIYNRKVVDGILYPDEEDFNLSLNLMSNSIELQYDILKTERFVKTLRNLTELQRVMKDPRIKQKYKDIISNLAKIKAGRIVIK